MTTIRRLRWQLFAAAGAALLLATTNALAGSGVGATFNLGEVNTVNAQSSLTGNAAGNPQLRVENSATVQNAFGVLGRITAGAPAAQTAGVRGINSGTNANGFGVWGFHQGSGAGVFGETGAGTGVLGKHTGTSGIAPGVQGETSSTAAGAVGVFGRTTNSAVGADSAGVKGVNAGSGAGVWGETNSTADDAVGVLGRTTSQSADDSSAAVKGVNAGNGAGVVGVNTNDAFCPAPCLGHGVIGESGLGSGVVGRHTTFTAIGGSAGVAGTSIGPAAGVLGIAANNIGVHGCSPACGTFFAGLKIGGFLEASSATESGGIGVLAAGGIVPGGQPVISAEERGTGVLALGETIGVHAEATGADAAAILGIGSGGGLAGKFEGNLHTTGRVTKAYTSGTSSQAIPIAYGLIQSNGVKLAGTPNVTSQYDAPNDRFLITIAGETYVNTSYITVVTPTVTGSPFFPSASSASGKLAVKLWNLSGNEVQTGFSFVTYKP